MIMGEEDDYNYNPKIYIIAVRNIVFYLVYCSGSSGDSQFSKICDRTNSASH